VSYQVELNDGQLWKRHVDQLVKDSSEGLDKNDIDKSDIENLNLNLVWEIQYYR